MVLFLSEESPLAFLSNYVTKEQCHRERVYSFMEAGSFSPKMNFYLDQRPETCLHSLNFGCSFLHNFYHHQSIESERTRLIPPPCILQL